MTGSTTDWATPRPGRGHRIVVALLGLLFLVVLLGGFGLLRLRNGPRPRSGEIDVAGLSAPVEVLRDSLGIPQVWASSIEDAFFAQGFLHASDRLWQMEQFRRVASGRLSELFGEQALPSDRFLRTLGMRGAAERAVPTLCADCRRRIDAYVAGVNAALEEWSGPLPPEFVVLRARPEPWDVVDALAIEKVMAWDLAEYDEGLLLADAQRRGGQELLDLLLPRYPAGAVTILGDTAAGTGPVPRVATGALPLAAELIAAAAVPEFARALLDAGSVLRASNSWVVGGARTRSGKPLLANDMHLNLALPTLWYLMGLHAPGLDVVGVTLPGTPGVVAGRSAAVAWGFTNAMVDDADLYVERLDPSDPTRYLVPGGSEPFVEREEEIRVRGQPDPVRLRVRETRHGPIVGEVDARAGGELLALRWVGHDPSPSAEAVFAMNTARSVAEFVEALRSFRDPHQNVVFADTAGTFGYWMAGRVPLRRSGIPSILPVPGWTADHDWIGDLPFEEHPHLINPARGFVVAANNPPDGGRLSGRINAGFDPPYRAQRITELLDTPALLDATALAAMQMDVTSLFARRHRDGAVAAYRQAGEDARADSLAAWDGVMAADRREPVLFWGWIELVRFRLARDLYGGPPGYFPTSALDRMLAAGQVSPSVTTSVVREVIGNAGAFDWGSAHQLHLDHPLGAVKVVGRLLGFARAPLPLAGDAYTVSAADHSGRYPPYSVRHGPSVRHVADLADPDAGGFVLPGGESGFPGSRHAVDQLPRWLAGALVPLPLRRDRVEARAIRRLRLVPR